MSLLDDLIAHYTAEQTILRRQAELLESGRLRTGQKTVEHPEWRDTTQESLDRVRQQLTEIDALLARSARKAEQ